MSITASSPHRSGSHGPLQFAVDRGHQGYELDVSSPAPMQGATAPGRPAEIGFPRRAHLPPLSVSAELKRAVFESLRNQADAEPAEDPRDGQQGWGRIWMGLGAVALASAIASSLFLTLALRDRTGVSLAAVASSTRPGVATNPAGSQPRVLDASAADNHVTREQSDRLLELFVLWRNKTNAGDVH